MASAIIIFYKKDSCTDNTILMKQHRVFIQIAFSIIFTIFGSAIYAQNTIVKGTVVDSITKQPLANVSVFFKGRNGTTTDANGKYELQTIYNVSTIQFSYVGLRTLSIAITKNKTQEVNVAMALDQSLSNVTVTSKRRIKYSNRNNPAVELIRKVIENKSKNRTEVYDYVQYDQYEKLQLSLSKVPEKIASGKALKKYQFLFENKDTTKLEGKTLLPVYIEEALSKVYYRKSPEKTKTIVVADKKVNLGEYIDKDGVSQYLNRLYENVEIYDNNIPLFTYQFLSPIADLAPSFYMFFIRDTITEANGQKLIHMYFTPRNTNDLLFRGNMYITLDGNYAVQKCNMFISKNANINWIKEMHIDLAFEKTADNHYHVSKSTVMADAGISKTKGGIFGERTVLYNNFTINQPLKDSIYSGESLVKREENSNLPDSFWLQKRPEPLTKAEAKVYSNIDSLEKMPSFKRTMALATLLLAGYTSLGKYEIGPVNAFYSFNPVEGFRGRIGGRTTPNFSKRIYFENYGAYGFKDQKFKYYLSSTYSLNKKSIYTFPLNYIKASAQYDTKIPGQELQFVQEDNFLLSFKRGNNDKWLYNHTYRVDYVHEFSNHLSYTLGFKNWKQEAADSLVYLKTVNNLPFKVDNLTTTELSAELRWAPKEQFYQGKVYRIPIVNKYPIITLRAVIAPKGVFGSEFSYQSINLRVEKRMYLSQFGFSDIVLEGGNIFGKLPYPLQTIHRANQTYAYQLNSYNLMNFLEFVSDHYVGLTIDHHFNGLIFNRIPLLKKLKLRELVSFKMLAGGVRSENNPDLNPDLIKYPTLNGVPTTYSLGKQPYMEGSVGIGNIFKLIRVDLVKRFNYLDHPTVTEWGIRTRFKFDF